MADKAAKLRQLAAARAPQPPADQREQQHGRDRVARRLTARDRVVDELLGGGHRGPDGHEGEDGEEGSGAHRATTVRGNRSRRKVQFRAG